MNYLRRQFVNERLRLPVSTSYRVVGSGHNYGERISSDWVIELLNESRRGEVEPLKDIPSDILTPEEMAKELIESNISPKVLILWSKRTRNPLPHFKFGERTRRFRREWTLRWLDACSLKRRSA